MNKVPYNAELLGISYANEITRLQCERLPPGKKEAKLCFCLFCCMKWQNFSLKKSDPQKRCIV